MVLEEGENQGSHNFLGCVLYIILEQLDDEHVNLVLPIEGMKSEIIAKIVLK
jgi:hypothetical protein